MSAMARAVAGALFAAFWIVACTVDAPPSASGKDADAGSENDAEPDNSWRYADIKFTSDLPPNPLDAPTSGKCVVGDPSTCAPGFVCYTGPPMCNWVLGDCTRLTDSVCHERTHPVCGCDGRIYSNSCDAYNAGTVLAPLENCPALEGHFPCGSEYCNPLLEYCQRTVFDQRVIGRGCNPLPPSCVPSAPESKPDCACWPAMPRQCTGCMVVDGPTPGLDVECPVVPVAL
jgi:hypothetical protein